MAFRSMAAPVMFVAAVLAAFLGSRTLQAAGGVLAVMMAMVIAVDVILPRANRLHLRYRGRWGVKSFGDRRSDRR